MRRARGAAEAHARNAPILSRVKSGPVFRNTGTGISPPRLKGVATSRSFSDVVEQWDDADSHVEELIALTGDYRVARAALSQAMLQERLGQLERLVNPGRLDIGA
jgi:hypothetical protein